MQQLTEDLELLEMHGDLRLLQQSPILVRNLRARGGKNKAQVRESNAHAHNYERIGIGGAVNVEAQLTWNIRSASLLLLDEPSTGACEPPVSVIPVPVRAVCSAAARERERNGSSTAQTFQRGANQRGRHPSRRRRGGVGGGLLDPGRSPGLPSAPRPRDAPRQASLPFAARVTRASLGGAFLECSGRRRR